MPSVTICLFILLYDFISSTVWSIPIKTISYIPRLRVPLYSSIISLEQVDILKSLKLVCFLITHPIQ